MSVFNKRRAAGLSLAVAAVALALTAGVTAPSVSRAVSTTHDSAGARLADDPNGAVVLYNGIVYRAFIDGSPDLSYPVTGA